MVGKPKVEFECKKCGKKQPKYKSKSNENWNLYDGKAKCECGCKFIMHIDDIPIEGGEQ